MTASDQLRIRRMIIYLVIGIIGLTALLLFGGQLFGDSLIVYAILFIWLVSWKLFSMYYNPNGFSIPESLVTREVVWLYGPARLEWAGAKERAVAEDRIRQRRVTRRQFFVLFIPFWLIGAGFVFAIASTFTQYAEPGGGFFYALTAVFVAILLVQTLAVFPTMGMLEKRERTFANPPPVLPKVVPSWGWAFIVTCAAIPVVSLGGLLPGIIGLSSAGLCYTISRDSSRARNLRLVLCTVTTAIGWGLFIYLLRVVLTRQGF